MVEMGFRKALKLKWYNNIPKHKTYEYHCLVCFNKLLLFLICPYGNLEMIDKEDEISTFQEKQQAIFRRMRCSIHVTRFQK